LNIEHGTRNTELMKVCLLYNSVFHVHLIDILLLIKRWKREKEWRLFEYRTRNKEHGTDEGVPTL
jgi:hypothetical protein